MSNLLLSWTNPLHDRETRPLAYCTQTLQYANCLLPIKSAPWLYFSLSLPLQPLTRCALITILLTYVHNSAYYLWPTERSTEWIIKHFVERCSVIQLGFSYSLFKASMSLKSFTCHCECYSVLIFFFLWWVFIVSTLVSLWQNQKRIVVRL